ncbi:MAG: L,D-transpeptidase, partial [Lachnospiraceae bacterium]|nr:L,D-transpeptidase [Lachnospiraceae bacterium]
SAVKIVSGASVTAGKLTTKVDVSNAGVNYGKWNAKVVTTVDGKEVSLAKSTYNIAPEFKSFASVKTDALEKKKQFQVKLTKLTNVYGVKKVQFLVYNPSKDLVTTVTGKVSNTNTYTGTVKLKKLNFELKKYTIKARLVDNNGRKKVLSKTCICDERVKKGTLTATPKNAEVRIKLKKPYVPGNIKKITFNVLLKKGNKFKKVATSTGTLKKKTYSGSVVVSSKGKYKVIAVALTSWKKNVKLGNTTFNVKRSDLGKNGWRYEKYAGKTYKFYYKNNKKVTDLTKILNIKESTSSNVNKFYIEINRAACVVTIYAYDKQTKKYNIPVKRCAVSVGRDIWTTAGTSGLNTNSSYTPLGTFSICSNGTAAKYSLKPMHEPDGSTVYARWASHIVGNVYFHSIAVGSSSHYALSATSYNKLGSPASAGCIRMTVRDAKWLYDYASVGSTVKIVKGNSAKPGPLGKPVTIKISGVSYDPTDPEVPNSRKKADYKAGRITGYITKSGKMVGKVS